MSTVADMLVTVPMAKDMFSKIDKLLQLYLTISVTTCTAERSFSALSRFKGVLGVRSYFFTYIFFYVLMCVYVSRTRFPSSRAIKDVSLEIYLFLYHVFMPLNLFHFASRRFFSAFSPFGGDDPYFPVPLYFIKM